MHLLFRTTIWDAIFRGRGPALLETFVRPRRPFALHRKSRFFSEIPQAHKKLRWVVELVLRGGWIDKEYV